MSISEVNLPKVFLSLGLLFPLTLSVANAAEIKVRDVFVNASASVSQCCPLSIASICLYDKYKWVYYGVLGGVPFPWRGDMDIATYKKIYEEWKIINFPILDTAEKWATGTTYAVAGLILVLPVLINGAKFLAQKNNFKKLEQIFNVADKVLNTITKVVNLAISLMGLYFALSTGNVPLICAYSIFLASNLFCIYKHIAMMLNKTLIPVNNLPHALDERRIDLPKGSVHRAG